MIISSTLKVYHSHVCITTPFALLVVGETLGANVVSDLSLITRDIYTNYIPNDRSSCALSYETIRQWIGQCLAKLPKSCTQHHTASKYRPFCIALKR